MNGAWQIVIVTVVSLSSPTAIQLEEFLDPPSFVAKNRKLVGPPKVFLCPGSKSVARRPSLLLEICC